MRELWKLCGPFIDVKTLIQLQKLQKKKNVGILFCRNKINSCKINSFRK